jgi:hypothetical protein
MTGLDDLVPALLILWANFDCELFVAAVNFLATSTYITIESPPLSNQLSKSGVSSPILS